MKDVYKGYQNWQKVAKSLEFHTHLVNSRETTSAQGIPETPDFPEVIINII